MSHILCIPCTVSIYTIVLIYNAWYILLLYIETFSIHILYNTYHSHLLFFSRLIYSFSLSLSLSLSLFLSLSRIHINNILYSILLLLWTKLDWWETKFDWRETKHKSLNVWNGNNNKEITTNNNYCTFFSSLYQS